MTYLGATKDARSVSSFSRLACSTLGCGRTRPGGARKRSSRARATPLRRGGRARAPHGRHDCACGRLLGDGSHVRVPTPIASVEWDLGRPVRLRAAYLQGDNNDDFFLSGSDDGKAYREIWTAGSVRGAGMRPRNDRNPRRHRSILEAHRTGGDAAVSASELEVFEEVPAPWPPLLRALEGQRPRLPGEVEGLTFGIVAALALLLHRATFPSWVRGLFLVVPVLFGIWTYVVVSDAWPPGQPVIDMLRAVSAGVAAAAVVRLAVRPEDVHPGFVTGWLAAMAFLAMTTFYNMWQPQFDDVVDGRQTWVHTWDMRVYFPTAKYFDELGFDGLYLASVAAYLEDAPGASEARIRDVELRDLRTYDMTTVSAVHDQIAQVKYRFSPERWTLFKHDMAYFWRTMGPGGYLGSLRDHGGNATPAWLLVPWLMFRNAIATEKTLLLTGLLDPLLLVGFFVAAWRTFGVRTALICVTVYGASTFPWFGSNWAGSTLRNDWMVCVGFGVCALRTERWTLGGALLAAAAMIRAFPAVSVFFLVAPALIALGDKIRAGNRPSLREFFAEARPLVRALVGATACVAVLFTLSTARFGFEHSWGDWSHKIALHSVQPNVNHVGLRTLIQFDPSKTIRALSQTGGDWSWEQSETFVRRRPLYILVIALFTVLALAGARGRDLRQAALIGMMMIPIYFYASNYYLHYVFVLPLLIDYSEDNRRQRLLWGLVSTVVLLICVSEYWGFRRCSAWTNAMLNGAGVA